MLEVSVPEEGRVVLSGRFELVNLSERVRNVLRLAGLDRVFVIR